MEVENIGTIVYRDCVENQEACITIRLSGETILLSLSLKANGDIETIMTFNDVKRLIDLLQEALKKG